MLHLASRHYCGTISITRSMRERCQRFSGMIIAVEAPAPLLLRVYEHSVGEKWHGAIIYGMHVQGPFFGNS
jgi:hypothetical protein